MFKQKTFTLLTLAALCIAASGSTIAAVVPDEINPNVVEDAETSSDSAEKKSSSDKEDTKEEKKEQKEEQKKEPAKESAKEAPKEAPKEPNKEQQQTNSSTWTDLWNIDRQYAEKMLNKVDELVGKHFYDATTAKEKWPDISKEYRESILKSTNLGELSSNINAALAKLKTSHTQFLTINDETFYFLRGLFAPGQRRPPDKKELSADFAGFVTGGVDFAPNEVRYVLDGTPARQVGMLRGDKIISIDGQPYKGLISLRGSAGNAAVFKVKRGDQNLTLALKIGNQNIYDVYAQAVEKSARIEKTEIGPIGYIHLWCGGDGAHDALEDAMIGKLSNTKGLILDLRDGYGANSLEDLDVFYRSKIAYPTFVAKDRNGKTHTTKLYYDRPIVALINGGSRSGKEMLAFSLKRTHRATLVGSRTAGAVVGGRLFPIDDRSAFFLAVIGAQIDGEVLEAKGVTPDIEVPQRHDGAKDPQFDRARAELLKRLSIESAKR